MDKNSDFMSMREFLAAHSPVQVLRAVVLPDPTDASRVHIRPWIAEGQCTCKSPFIVDKDIVRARPVGETYCCGTLHTLAEVRFDAGGGYISRA